MAEHTTEQERLLRTVEQQWQVRLSVHDELGLLRDRDGALLLPAGGGRFRGRACGMNIPRRFAPVILPNLISRKEL